MSRILSQLVFREIHQSELPAGFVGALDVMVAALKKAGTGALEQHRYHPGAVPHVDRNGLESWRKYPKQRDTVARYEDNSHFRFKKWLKANGFYKTGEVWEGVKRMLPSPRFSGYHWYPPGGFMGWHTNENKPGPRLYATWTPVAKKSFLRYQVPGTRQIRTSFDREGWTFRWFDIGDRDATRFWHCLYTDVDRISFGFRSDVVHKLKGHHAMRGLWHLPEMPTLGDDNYWVLRLKHLRGVVEPRKPRRIRFANIGHKGLSDRERETSRRFAQCHPLYPGIIVDGMPNPWGRRYRMIDGRNRLHKLIAAGRKSGFFYVLKPEHVVGHIEPKNPC